MLNSLPLIDATKFHLLAQENPFLQSCFAKQRSTGQAEGNTGTRPRSSMKEMAV